MSGIYELAMAVASREDVSTPPDKLVLYSVSFLPSKENKERAFSFLETHPGSLMIDQTVAGRKLIELGLEGNESGLSDQQIAAVWSVASKRLIEQAAGNITAFVEKADPRSVFRSRELPEILNNSRIKTINGEDKFAFAKRFKD